MIYDKRKFSKEDVIFTGGYWIAYLYLINLILSDKFVGGDMNLIYLFKSTMQFFQMARF